METILIQGKSKKAIELLVELSNQLNLKQKRLTKDGLEDIIIAESIKAEKAAIRPNKMF